MSDLICIAVRMKSSRLQKKALKNIAGKPLIERLLDRLTSEFSKTSICLCTSDHPDDSVLIDVAKNYQIPYLAGHQLDVMQRFIMAGEAHGAKNIIRVTGDNPLTDPIMIKQLLEFHKASEAEYSFCDDIPIGTRSEVVSLHALKRIYDQLSNSNSSEYMTYMLNRPDKLNVRNLKIKDQEIYEPQLSLTVDTIEDFEFVETIYQHFQSSSASLKEIVNFCRNHSDYQNRLIEPLVSPPKIEGIDYSFIDDKKLS